MRLFKNVENGNQKKVKDGYIHEGLEAQLMEQWPSG